MSGDKHHPLANTIPKDPQGRILGRVIAHHGKVVRIALTDGEMEWKRPHRQDWVVGDLLVIEKGRPRSITPRINELARKSPGGGEDVLAANLDFLLIVTACGEHFKKPLLDRFIVAAANANIRPLIALNKIDLPGSSEYTSQLDEYRSAGIMALAVSAATGEGIESLSEELSGKITVMAGQSGVGKTSILNRLVPDLKLKTAELSQYSGKGRHTTTISLMVALPGAGAVVDSPGIRQFAPTGLAPEDLAHYFPGMEKLAGSCKFRDCMHDTEPGCAVKAAVEQGEVSEQRYASYIRILESIKDGREQQWWRRPEK